MKIKFLYLISCILYLISFTFADYTNSLDRIVGKLSKEIPENKVVVVFNILRNGRDETQNSVDLAIKLGMKLAEKGKRKNLNVIERAVGERFAFEEKKYTVQSFTSQELKKLLEGFKADIGIVGQYQLLGNHLILENIRAIAVPSPESPPKIISAYDRLDIPLNTQESLCFIQNETLVPQPPDSITDYFLTASTDNNFVSAQIITYPEGDPLPNNYVQIGNYYLLKIDLKEDAFLYIFSYDEAANTVYLLHPISKEKDRLIKSGIFYPYQDGKAIEAQPPPGRNFVKLFATKRPIPIIIPQSQDYRLTFKELADFVREIKGLSGNDWASYRLFIYIGER